MLSLFRKMRKRIIEKKKIRSYLLYAIGEVILIVFGVLIALQVNNWNEGRKNATQKQTYMESLIQDLQSDEEALLYKQEEIARDSLAIGKLRGRLSSANATIDTVITILTQDFNPYIPSSVRFNSTTFNAIESSGDINLFELKTIQLLTQLKNRQTAYLGYSEENLSHYKRTTNDFFNKYPIPQFSGSIGRSTKMGRYVFEEAKTADLVSDLNGLLTVKYVTAQLNLIRIEGLLDYTRKVRKEIQQVYEQ